MFVFNTIIPEIHVKGEIHELLADFAEREDVKADSHSYGRTSVIWSHPSVVPNLEPEQKDFSGEKKMHEESLKRILVEQSRDVKGLREVVCCRTGKEKSGGEEKKPSRHPSHPITVAQILAWRGISALLYNSLGGHFRPIKH